MVYTFFASMRLPPKEDAHAKEGTYSLNWTRLSSHDFADNQERLPLFALAYNMGNFLRRLELPRSVSLWSLRTLQTRLVKIGAKVVKHAR